jgi:hydroxyethylthiazole kinase-like sugar kinase family protein
MELRQTIGANLAAIREKRPLVHSITNFVVMNEIANALVLNIGTLTPKWIDAMEMAAKVSGDRPGTFHTELYNALYSVKAADIESGAEITL